MTSDKTLTSASRLHSEVSRFRQVYLGTPKKTVSELAPLAFSLDGKIAVPRGMELLGRLIRDVSLDLAVMDDGERKKKYRQTLERKVAALLDFKLMHANAAEFANSYLDDLTFERLEALNDWLTGTGRVLTLEQVRVNAVLSELDALVGEIETSERTDIDGFLLERLRELKVALEHFELFGGDGVADCLRRLAGEIGIARSLGGAASEALIQRTMRVGGFVIGALGALAFVYASVESIGWARGLLAGQPIFPAIVQFDDKLLIPSLKDDADLWTDGDGMIKLTAPTGDR